MANSGKALFVAAGEGNVEDVNRLIKLDPTSVHFIDEFGWTPLMNAAWKGHIHICKTLIDNESNLDASDKRGRTAIYFAIEENHEAIVRLLIAEGADLSVEDKNGQTPVRFARRLGNGDVVKWLEIGKQIPQQINFSF